MSLHRCILFPIAIALLLVACSGEDPADQPDADDVGTTEDVATGEDVTDPPMDASEDAPTDPDAEDHDAELDAEAPDTSQEDTDPDPDVTSDADASEDVEYDADTSEDVESDVGDDGVPDPVNMPSSFEIIAETDFADPEDDGFYVHGSLSMTVDETAPVSCCDVGEKIFSVGSTGGSGISLSNNIASAEATSVYVAVWMKVSENFRNHSSGITKVFYVFSNSDPKMILSTMGDDLELRSLLRHAPGGTGYTSPNVGDPEDARVQRGQWHLIEYLVQSSSAPGEEDGAMRWWLDGVLVGDYDGLDTHYEDEDLHWNSVQWNTIWGGVDDEVTEEDGDMYWWASHFIAGGLVE